MRFNWITLRHDLRMQHTREYVLESLFINRENRITAIKVSKLLEWMAAK